MGLRPLCPTARVSATLFLPFPHSRSCGPLSLPRPGRTLPRLWREEHGPSPPRTAFHTHGVSSSHHCPPAAAPEPCHRGAAQGAGHQAPPGQVRPSPSQGRPVRPGSSLASLRGALCSHPGLGWAQCSAVATLKVFIIFEQGALHFRFALGSAAGLGGPIPRGAGGWVGCVHRGPQRTPVGWALMRETHEGGRLEFSSGKRGAPVPKASSGLLGLVRHGV